MIFVQIKAYLELAWNYVMSLDVWAFIILLGVVGFITGLQYIKHRMKELGAEDGARMKEHFIVPSPQKIVNHRWDNIRSMFESGDENNWRLAIIDADTMLEDMLGHMGVPGKTLGERLKSLNRSSFPMLNYAWEAHKVRNRIAHEGTRFQMSHADAWRVFKMYEAVFQSNRYVG